MPERDQLSADDGEWMFMAPPERAAPSARCPHCGATNGEHKSHGRYRCMGGTFSLSDKDQPNA